MGETSSVYEFQLIKSASMDSQKPLLGIKVDTVREKPGRRKNKSPLNKPIRSFGS